MKKFIISVTSETTSPEHPDVRSQKDHGSNSHTAATIREAVQKEIDTAETIYGLTIAETKFFSDESAMAVVKHDNGAETCWFFDAVEADNE